nr:hypothetical protein [uncultured Kingella sp.]
MNAREFLDFAQKHAGQSEAADRSAASRAYYAVYHACLDYAIAQGFDFSPFLRGGYHSQLIRFYTEHDNRQYRAIGKTLKQMRDCRVMADYALEAPFTAARAHNQIRQAVALLGTLEKLAAG